MSAPIAFTLDLEDHRPEGSSAEPRYRAVTERLLDWLDDWQVRGTVFVVGELIGEAPDLILSAAARSHEIGLHGESHTPLPELGPARFREATARATGQLADLTGCAVAGFRAPIFSLVPQAAWAPEILVELGYSYSSSVMPARHPLYGWPQAPRRPFRWPCGLVELPCPVTGAGPVRLPLLGGTGLRAAPGPAVAWARRRGRRLQGTWLYAHPYDFDPEEPRWTTDELGRLGSRLLWHGRRRMASRVRATVAGANVTMSEMAAAQRQSPVFTPSASGWPQARRSASEFPGSQSPSSKSPGSQSPGSEFPGSQSPSSELAGSKLPGSETSGSAS